MVTLVIEGQLPNLNDYTKANRSNLYVGAKMKAAAEGVITAHIRGQLRNVRFNGPVKLAFRWYEPNKKRDLDNICFDKKFILDALVGSRIITNDGWQGVVGFTDQFYIDKDRPRIEVDIEEA